MGALSLLPLTLPSSPLGRRHPSPPSPLISTPTSLFSSKPSRLSRESSLLRCHKGNSSDSDDASAFLDEDGVVEDMDGYLNYLSLEYDSVWDTKPSWCQPWTILLTGVTVIASSWVFLHSAVISAGVFFLISAWWYIFLYAYPKAYSDMIAERRKNVTSGIEDTYGLRKSQ